MSSIHSRESFLKNAQNRKGKLYLDVNPIKKIPASRSDEKYVIESRYHKRPDLLAHKLFGKVSLWWVFSQRNPDLLVDPLEDFTAGKEIYLPTQKTIDTVLR